MIDNLEDRLRENLRATPLPAAPASLIEYVSRLPLEADVRRNRGSRPLRLVSFSVALLVVAFAIGLLATGGSTPTLAPQSGSSTPAMRASASPTAGVLSAPGISFELAPGWSNQSSAIEYPVYPGVRYVGLAATGMKVCPSRPYSSLPPTPRPTGCIETADQPGSAILTVMEYTHQLPSARPPGPAARIGPYEVWEQASEGSTRSTWTIPSPDGGLYQLLLTSPAAEIEGRRSEVRSMLDNLQLSHWEAAPEVVDGRVHVDTQRGFSFDYPAGWTLYWPQDVSMMDVAVVTVSSSPLDPPCEGDTCQRFATPPGAVAVEFRMSGGYGSPDWSNATTTIGGQPAFGPENWGSQNATSAEEGHTWSVRLPDQSVLGIYASLRGPGLEALRDAMDDVLASIRIED